MNEARSFPGHRKPFLAALWFVLFWTQTGWAESVVLRTESNSEALRLLFYWPIAVEIQSSLEGRDLLLRFSHALDCPETDSLPSAVPEWIEAVSKGYDSLLLRTSRDVQVSVQRDGASILLVLTPSTGRAVATDREEQQGQLRLELLRVRLLVEKDKVVAAHELLEALSARHPENPLVLAARGSFEERSGRWRRADHIYDKALGLAPGNEDIIQARRILIDEFRSGVEVEMGPKTVTDAWDEFRLQVRGTMFVRNHLRVGFAFHQTHVTLHQAQGEHERGSSVRRHAEMFLRHDTEGGARVTGSLYANGKTAGIGFQWSRPDLRGTTTLEIEHRRPFEEFVESILDAGTRDRVEASREQRITPKLNGWVAGAYGRYRLDGRELVASSGSFNSGLDYVLAKEPRLGIQYGFDGEYRSSARLRKTPAGDPYLPLPLYSREVHSINLHLGADVGSRLRTESFGGFAADRLGGSGPFFGASVFCHLSQAFDLKLDFERRLNSVNTGEVVYQLFGQLIWKKR